MSTDETMTLEGPAAIELWKQGKEAWNLWVKEHPEAEIDFTGVDFSPYRNDPECQIPAHAWPFAGFHFPKGTVDFEGAQFGKGKVNFLGTQFGEGTVEFGGAQFGDGEVDFRYAQFGDGEVHFFKAQFGEGGVSFNSTRAQGDFTLSHARLGKGTYNFERGDFERRAFFDGLQGVKQVESFSFRHASFEKPLVLSTVNNEPFGCVVDLTDTRINSHVSLQGLTCTLNTENPSLPDKGWRTRLLRVFPDFPCQMMQDLRSWVDKRQAKDPVDEERFRRLKELTEANRNHGKALEFKAQEMQARRWHKTTRWDLWLEFWFQLFGNYGRSELRPLVGLGGVWFLFGLLYSGLSAWCSQSTAAFYVKLGNGLAFSTSQMLPLIPGFRESREAALKALFPGASSDVLSLSWGMPPDVLSLPGGFSALAFFQGLLALALLFLLGLALRNRFRL